MPTSATKKSSKKTKPSRAQLGAKTSPRPISTVAIPSTTALAKTAVGLMTLQDKLIVRLIAVAWVVVILVSGLAHMTYYSDLSQSTADVSGTLPDGFLKSSVEIVALTISLLSGGAYGLLTESQQLSMTLGYLLLWLVLVWLLRHVWNKTSVMLRDGLYNAPAPLLSTAALVVLAALQMVPLALLVSLLAAISMSGILSGGVWLLGAFAAVVVAAAGTLYWLIGTMIALVVVTIPGTYPLAAVRSAKTLVKGYRRQIMTKVLGMLAIVSVVQLVTVLALIALDALSGYRMSWLVVGLYQLIAVASYVFAGSFMYVLYRRLIDERS